MDTDRDQESKRRTDTHWLVHNIHHTLSDMLDTLKKLEVQIALVDVAVMKAVTLRSRLSMRIWATRQWKICMRRWRSWIAIYSECCSS